MQSIATTVQDAYDVSSSVFNLISLVYLIVYLPINFPSNYVIDSYGPRVGVSIGVALTLVGLWVKCFINSQFYLVIIGQTFAGIG